MSLVPPIHFVVVEASAISISFEEVLEKERWSERMPTNIVLVSGPSKTADIELVLSYGVHGPQELIVFIIE